MPSEAAHHAESFAQVGGMCPISGKLRPGDCQLRGDRRGTSGLPVADEVGDTARVVLELETQRTAQRDVVVHRRVQRAHASAPGQGWASARSAIRSTLASTAVVAAGGGG